MTKAEKDIKWMRKRLRKIAKAMIKYWKKVERDNE